MAASDARHTCRCSPHYLSTQDIISTVTCYQVSVIMKDFHDVCCHKVGLWQKGEGEVDGRKVLSSVPD